ncbi:DUF72 domain-containing protein [Candidatus Hecatella orcuttiae]|jgi:uncharacterized protein YecE (DUF72 family)|uniref:DUF72 domain-containing protein n=1 Tax=Candidatus Hecatella orcuttiae TaxID=1935119 RepID=UPI0028682E47|nr:DUF72 domain-containing protein [Candidatus Hecatella orcuttiae]
MPVKVGCCGFPVSKPRYYEALSLVEINSTFYRYHSPTLLSKWRREAPSGFEFTVKAHRDLSHTHRLEWKPESAEAFQRMVETCRILGSRVLLIQTPGSFRPTPENLKKAEIFFRKAKRDGLNLVWETRGGEWFNPELQAGLAALFEKLQLVHCVDPLLGHPPFYIADKAYFRLHGLGERLYYYQYSNEELRKLAEAVEKTAKTAPVYVLFNNLSMYVDAHRFQAFLKTGQFPPLMDCFGLEAFEKLVEKIRYPITRRKLSETVGWRLVETKRGEQVPLSVLLEKIPEKNFESLKKLLGAARKFLDLD